MFTPMPGMSRMRDTVMVGLLHQAAASAGVTSRPLWP
jgi:hypothetical protein